MFHVVAMRRGRQGTKWPTMTLVTAQLLMPFVLQCSSRKPGSTWQPSPEEQACVFMPRVIQAPGSQGLAFRRLTPTDLTCNTLVSNISLGAMLRNPDPRIRCSRNTAKTQKQHS